MCTHEGGTWSCSHNTNKTINSIIINKKHHSTLENIRLIIFLFKKYASHRRLIVLKYFVYYST